MVEVLSTIFCRNTEQSSLFQLYVYNTAHSFRPAPPVFAVRREPRIHRPTACTYLSGCTT